MKAYQRGPGSYQFGQEAFASEGGHSWLTMGAYRSKALSVVKPHENLEPVPADHLLRRLMDNPNHFDTAFDLAYELQMFEELCGVAYEWLVPNDYGVPVERWVIPSHWVWPRTGGGRYVAPDHPHADELIQYYEIRPWGGMGSAGMLKFPPNEVVMHLWHSPINKIDGYSKLAAVANWIDEEESISRSRWAQAQNVARPEFWVELSESYDDPSDDKIARIEAKFAAKLQGELNYGKPVIGPPGAKITPLSFTPSEMAYFESEEQIRDMILSTFKVPPAAVGIVKEMTYGSILATLASLCTYCLNPRLVKRGQTWTKRLANRWDEPGRKLRIWYDDCVPADPTQVNADLDTDFRSCAVSPNEVRAIRGRKPWKFGGDDPMVQGPAGLMPLPLNTKHDLGVLAELIAPMSSAAGKQRSTAFEGGEPAERIPEEDGGVEGQAGSALRESRAAEEVAGGGPEKPNGPPHKDLPPAYDANDPYEVSPDPDPHGFPVEEDAFCPTGQGGGINPTCPTTHGPTPNEPNAGRRRRKPVDEESPPEEEEDPGVSEEQAGGLDAQGGRRPLLPLDVLRQADFITLPDGVKGTNCFNCVYAKDAACTYHDKVDLRGQPVNERNCCAYWDSPGVLRAWEEGYKELNDLPPTPPAPAPMKEFGDPAALLAWLLAKHLVDRWEELEPRLGRKAALAAAAASLSDLDLPAPLSVIIVKAEAYRGLEGFFNRELGGSWGTPQVTTPPLPPPGPANRLKGLLKPQPNGVH